LILLFFEVVYILLTIVNLHYIFPISFGTTEIFMFQIYYSKFSFSYEDYHDGKKLLYNYNWYYSNKCFSSVFIYYTDL